MAGYKAAIFDLDGTLLNTLDDLKDAMNHTMQVFSFPQHTTKEIREFVGNGVRYFAAKATPGGYDHPMFEEIVAEYIRYYSIHSDDKTAPYEGIHELIHNLLSSGIAVAVVSNKSHAAAVELCKKYFPEINVVIGEKESDGIKRKPAPDMVYLAAEKLGVSLKDCVYIGDSEVDVKTAKNAGIDCISVLWGFRDRDVLEREGAKRFAENADELYHKILD
ncbi:MAG: HAD family hydrolase [Ruminococcaceae bacterium]|nr:HAD family hydrolase [Oscillospiraceae bacterium]